MYRSQSSNHSGIGLYAGLTSVILGSLYFLDNYRIFDSPFGHNTDMYILVLSIMLIITGGLLIVGSQHG